MTTKITIIYRFSKDRAEIIKKLEEKFAQSNLLTIWQKNNDGSRKMIDKMHFHALIAEDGVFTIESGLDKISLFDKLKEVYFLLEEHDFVFKTKLAMDQKDLITFQIPKEIRLKELRVQDRIYYSLEDKKNVEVSFFLKKSNTQLKIACPMVNISVGGMCLVITKETLSVIDLSREVLVSDFNGERLTVVKNARVYKNKSFNQDELYAIGVQFKQPAVEPS